MAFRPGRYFWKLFIVNAAVMALILIGSVWVIVSQLDWLREEELSEHLVAQAAALEVAVRDRFDPAHAHELNSIAREVGSADGEGVRVTFVLSDGTVVGDSEAIAAEMGSHDDRGEIRQALAEGVGESVRWSHTVARNMKYVAVRVGTAADPLGVVRVSMASESIAARAAPAKRLALGLALVSVLAAILLALTRALLWSRRIRRITEAARSISGGDLSARVPVSGYDEVATLGRSLNTMRERLGTHLDTIERQRRTLGSLLSQLREGVVLVDADSRIVLINDEAIEMLKATPPSGASHVGRPVEACIPSRRLLDLLHPSAEIEKCGDAAPQGCWSGPAVDPARTDTREIELRLSTGSGERTVLARAFDVRLPGSSAVNSPGGSQEQVGRALLLTDITELARVMQVKADLAANASHELRTPLSAIRAAVDTLRSIGPEKDQAMSGPSVDIIDRHSGRMEAMIEDLLELSRLESGMFKTEVERLSGRALLQELHASFSDAATARGLHWRVAAPAEDAVAYTSPELLRIILRNLIENAFRFTERGGEVELAVTKRAAGVEFCVSDTGCGIALDQQQRVFERFYQVERARSGVDRGTGLGLSIVRHAAAAINAQIGLESKVGKGTRVTVSIAAGLPQGVLVSEPIGDE
jgi:two-component system phosphate regulon sensor histidine kinase PhoR